MIKGRNRPRPIIQIGCKCPSSEFDSFIHLCQLAWLKLWRHNRITSQSSPSQDSLETKNSPIIIGYLPIYLIPKDVLKKINAVVLLAIFFSNVSTEFILVSSLFFSFAKTFPHLQTGKYMTLRHFPICSKLWARLTIKYFASTRSLIQEQNSKNKNLLAIGYHSFLGYQMLSLFGNDGTTFQFVQYPGDAEICLQNTSTLSYSSVSLKYICFDVFRYIFVYPPPPNSVSFLPSDLVNQTF